MRVYRRAGSKVWQVYWKGQRFSTGFTDKPAAEAWFREYQRQQADPTYRPPDPSAILVRELAGFIERQTERGRAPGTITMYRTHAGHLIRVLGEVTPLVDIDLAAVERYVSQRKRETASSSTIWKEWCTLRGTLKRARKHKRYPYALDEVTPDDMQPDYVPLTRHLLMPDVVRLLRELEPERRAAVAFVVATGADMGCLERAEPGDVDVRAGIARVRGSKTRHRGRIIPIVAPFKDLAREAAKGLPFEPWPNMRRDLLRACKRAGVAPVTARDLRRSHGRILRNAGVHPSLIAPMLGHAPGSPVTALTYAQITPAELGAQIRRQGRTNRNRTRSRG